MENEKRVGGGFYGWVGGRTTTRYLNGRPPAPAVTQRRRRRRGGRHHPPWRTADDNDKESSDRGQQMMTATTTAAIAVSDKWDTSMPGVVGNRGRGGQYATMTWRARGHGIDRRDRWATTMVPPFFIVSTKQSISAARWWKRPNNDNTTKMNISMMERLEYELVREARDVLLCFSPTQIRQWSSLLVADTANDYLLSDGTMSPRMAAVAALASTRCHCPLVPTPYAAAATAPPLMPAAAEEAPSTGPQWREEERAK
jgi:hypothetical protein